MKNFRERWNMANCLHALSTTQLYEAAGNVFWLDRLETQFGSDTIPEPEVTWAQLDEGAALWTDAAFVSSNENEQYRRYIFPQHCLALTASTSHVQSRADQGQCCFHRLCLGAGHGPLFSFYEALLNALEHGDDAKTLKLYEAGLTATIRLRLTTSFTQLVTDVHVWSESVKASFSSASSDLMATVKMISAMVPNLTTSRATSVEKFRQELTKLGFQYKGQPLNKASAMGFQSLLVLVQDDA